MSDPGGVSNTAALAYAASKLDAAAVLSASHLQDMYQPYNLGFISAAYTAAHETMELLLKLYLKKGAEDHSAKRGLGPRPRRAVH